MSFRETLACGLQKCVGNLRESNDYSDFIVIVEDTSFRCHRCILSACSGFFNAMFKSPMKEQTEGCAKLEGMTSSTFDIIVNAVYKGIDGLSENNVLDVWAASEMLQIGYLTKQCHTFVMENMSVDNCFCVLNHAMLYAAEDVVNYSLDFISRNFKQVCGEEKLLHFPFDQFYKVIANDYLAIEHEELAVTAVLNWIKYVPQPAESVSLESGNNDENVDHTNIDQSSGDYLTNSLSSSGCQDNIQDDQAVTSHGVKPGESNTYSQSVRTRDSACSLPVGPEHCDLTNKGEDKTENRKQHLVKLLSACRLFTIKSNFLDSVLKNNARLLVETGAYTMMHEALMYTLDVSRRHDAWPDAAIHRASSEFKHIMVFLSDDKVKAYDLNTGIIVELFKLPENCKSSNCTPIIFDNNVYLLSKNTTNDTKEFYMLKDKTSWVRVNSINAYYLILLLPHGDSIYNCFLTDIIYFYQGVKLYRFCCTYGRDLEWSECGKLQDHTNCLVRFHKYILFFTTRHNVITVQHYNTETKQTHQCETSMSGTSQDMVSFTHEADVYVLQRNGSLWKVYSTDTTPVDFELVSKLWDFDCSLKGCVLYKRTLFIFCNSKQSKSMLPSCDKMFTKIKIIHIDSTSSCLPMTLKLAL